MKLAKRIAIVVAILIAAPFLVALFLPTDFSVEREVVIDKPKQEVFDYIKHLKNQVHYSKWFQLDPDTNKEYRGDDGTVGFVVAWDSDSPDVGKGEQEITRIVDGERVDVEIRMREPFESADPAYTITESSGDNQTKVTSGYLGKISYPFNLCCPFIADKIGADMQSNLSALKTVLEKR